MGVDLSQKIVDVVITFGNVWGHNSAAENLAGDIRRSYDIPVELKINDDELFEVRVKGEVIYSRKGEIRAFNAGEAVLFNVGKILGIDGKSIPPQHRPGIEEDPDEQAWMRSVCSGE